MRFVRLDPDLDPPARNLPGDAGVDLRARVDVTLEPGQQANVPTGVAVEIPLGFAGLVCPRSGLAARDSITIVNAPGVVDTGYTGEVIVMLHNLGTKTVKLFRGDRIAQMVVTPVVLGEWEEVDALDPAERGTRGLGSSGL
jgi:dUTP pyrophosphatase